MKILVYGSKGKLGKTFIEQAANSSFNIDIYCGAARIDDYESVLKEVSFISPDLILNLAAHTNTNKNIDCVDHAKMFESNVIGPLSLGKAALQQNCNLIHISTDYVLRVPIDNSLYTKTKKIADDLLVSLFVENRELLNIVYTSFFDDEWLSKVESASTVFETPKDHVNNIAASLIRFCQVFEEWPTQEVYIGNWTLPKMFDTVSKYRKVSANKFKPVDGNVKFKWSHAHDDEKIKALLAARLSDDFDYEFELDF